MQVHAGISAADSAASLPRYNRLVSSDGPALDVDTRAAMKRWVENWKRAGPLLDAERWRRLRAMRTGQRARMTLDLLSLWQPDRPGDDADALIRVQRAFALWRKKRR